MLNLLLLAVFRAVNAALVQTSFNPDEFWQSLEVAHRVCQGFGHLTWEWAVGLRSYVHPLLYTPLYASKIQLSGSASLFLPHLWQSLFAALNDYYIFASTWELFGAEAARWAAACQLLSWFNYFCLTRTYGNCFEALLTVAALHHWPHTKVTEGLNPETIKRSGPKCSTASQEASWVSSGHERLPRWICSKSRTLAVALATLSVIIRPSCALFWAAQGLVELVQCSDPGRFVLWECLPVGLSGLGLAMLVDRCFYGRWVVVPWEFLRFNLLEGGSTMYGSHTWHWNITQGFPVVLGPLLPLALYGAVITRDRRRLWQACWVLAVYSLPAHKEFRFLLPALHLVVPYCGLALASLRRRWHPSSSPAASSDPIAPISGPRSTAQQTSSVAAGSGRRGEAGAATTLHRGLAEVDTLYGEAAHGDNGGGGGGGGSGVGDRQGLRQRGERAASPISGNGGSGGGGRGVGAQWGLRQRGERTASPVPGDGVDVAGPAMAGTGRKPTGTTAAALWWRLVLLLCLGLNVPVALYFCLVHQRGLLDVTAYIAGEAAQRPDMSVLFLLPCHATPWRSHVRSNISMSFLDCSPPGYCAKVAALNNLNPQGCELPDRGAVHGSETAWFMREPLSYVGWRFPQGNTFSTIVTFDGSALQLGPWLLQQRCKLRHSFFNAHLSNGWELQRSILVYGCQLSDSV